MLVPANTVVDSGQVGGNIHSSNLRLRLIAILPQAGRAVNQSNRIALFEAGRRRYWNEAVAILAQAESSR